MTHVPAWSNTTVVAPLSAHAWWVVAASTENVMPRPAALARSS
jgi:hypothetical protein